MTIPLSRRDPGQILQAVYDGAEAINVNATVTATIGEVEVMITDTTDSIAIGNGSGVLAQVDSNHNLQVSAQNSLVTVPYDSIYPTYPNGVTEIYAYKKLASTVATVTVIYVDLTKNAIVSIVRT